MRRSASRGPTLDPSQAEAHHALPHGLALVAVENIHPGRLQPRTTTSVELVRQLAESMRAGRHEPLLEVESLPGRPGHYRIVCGEQRWRAAKEARVERVLVRMLDGLGHLARLQKQYEENRLRAGLTPADDAFAVLLMKSIKDIEHAEHLLAVRSIPFEPLNDKDVKGRADLEDHLASMKALLLENRIHANKSGSGLHVAPLSPWRETEHALGISEVARKRKLAVLRLEPEVLAEANQLPSNHAALIARVEGDDRRGELAARASQLSHRQLHAAVRRLRENPALTIDQALSANRPLNTNPLAFEERLRVLADLCRQIVRLLNNLKPRISDAERDQARVLLATLLQDMHGFFEPGAVA